MALCPSGIYRFRDTFGIVTTPRRDNKAGYPFSDSEFNPVILLRSKRVAMKER